MAGDKNSFVMYTEYLRHVQKMDMEQRGKLFTAILCYAAGKEIPELDAAADMAFSFIQDRMDRDNAAYMEKCEKRREAGKLGGRPKANGSSEKQVKAKKANGLKSKITLILILIMNLILILVVMIIELWHRRITRHALANSF